jgi:hypothetical protein
MPRYLWRDQYPGTAAPQDYTSIPASNYDRSGYAHNAFPEQIIITGTDVKTPLPIPEPYGPTRQPIPA